MEIYYNAAVSDEQRRQVERWAEAHRSNDIDSVAVHDELVSVHGTPARLALAAGTAIRSGDLAAELSTALANMRNIFRQ